MPLSARAVRSAKPRNKAYKLNDGRGLYLFVTAAGGKSWRLDYTFGGKRRTVVLGHYPELSLADARARREESRQRLENGAEPLSLSARRDRNLDRSKSDSFEAIAREWFAEFSRNWAPSHSTKVMGRLERCVFPWIGESPIAEVKPPDLLRLLRRIIDGGSLDTAHRARQICSQIFRYAAATGRAEHDPAALLKGAIPPVRQSHFAAITDPREVGPLMQTIEGYRGSPVTRAALQMAALTFVRPGELRGALWAEVDLPQAEWRIHGERMKMRQSHIVPLSRQAVAVLEDLWPLTRDSAFVFPSERARDRCMSENTVLAGLRRLGYTKQEMTGHGFRAMASTILNEKSWSRDAIERQLAHSDRDSVRAAYHRGQHLDERRRMMQWWADYLDSLRLGEPEPLVPDGTS